MMVFHVLREHNMYAKHSKHVFYQKQIHYLGKIIFKEGTYVDLKKIEAIMKWSSSKILKNIRSIMDLLG